MDMGRRTTKTLRKGITDVNRKTMSSTICESQRQHSKSGS